MSRALRISSILGIWLLVAGLPKAGAQEVDEVMLTFGYPSVGQVYVNAVFRGDQPLIAVTEILSLLYIPYERSANGFGFKGAYPAKGDKWEIDPLKFIVTSKGMSSTPNAGKFYQGETDLYITPDLFKTVFGFELTVNPYGLMLSLRSDNPLPVDERQKRQSLRQQLKDQAPENLLKTYPMLYPRKRAILGLGMLDYNLGIVSGTDYSQYTYNVNGGIEFLGGDIQGGVVGFKSNNSNNFNYNAIRWRYVFNSGLDPVKIPAISEISIGQLALTGPTGGNIRGISVSNTPLVPRRVLDLFAIEGITTADSEVELLIGGQLVDFTRADEVGYYRFTLPLTYGTVRIGLRIYTPQGEVLFEDRQLQIPFSFAPRGTLTYNMQLGFEENGDKTLQGNPVGHANAIYGITNNITVRVGANKGLDSTGTAFEPYGSLSARLLDQYLFNLDVLPNRFARASASVFYANNTSITAQYTQYAPTQDIKFNDGKLQESSFSYFLPVTVLKRASGFRIGADHIRYFDGEELRYQADVNTRIGQIVTRLNYREERITRADSVSAPKRLLTSAFTYTIPRNPGIPVFVRGMFFRASLSYDMKRIDATALGTLQFSQTVFKKGRLTLGYNRDFLNQINLFQVGLLYDFNALRTANQTTIRQRGKTVVPNVNQTFSGSLGADLKNGAILPTNRDQVGRAGATVRLFVDDNANSKWDKGEEIISAKAVKLDQSANMYIGSDGMLRITQLQSYWTYRLTVDLMALPDVNLAPLQPKFSFVADPNRYKQIDIPLYRTGTIEGYVYRQRATGAKLEPQPGLRLHLKREGDDDDIQREPLRTFADGGFYAFGLLPGNYTLLVDSGQLAFMGVQQEPDTLKFTIRALAEGDYIDTLEIRLVPRKADTTQTEEPPLTLAELERRLGDRLNKAVSGFIKSQENFYMGEYRLAYLQADSSLDYFYSDFALALKGSAAYLIGKKQEAWQYWSDARDRNPFIVLPDTSYLRSFTDTLTTGDRLARAPFNAVDSLPIEKAVLIADFEVKLGENLRKAITSFVEAQELFYRKRFVEAGLMVDSSLNYQITDHGLALKGSIAYVQGRRNEAIQLWLEARERNPHIILPDLNVLDRLMQPVAENTRNAKNASQLAP